MNTKLISHLVWMEFLKFKRPIIILWFFIFLLAWPWCLYGLNTLNHESPAWVTNIWSQPISWHLISFGNSLVTLFALGLSAATGLRVRALSFALTIKTRDLILSKAFLILLFFVLPQTVAIAGTLALNGFHTDEILSTCGQQILEDFLRLSAMSLLAAWCASPGLLLITLLCLFAIPSWKMVRYQPELIFEQDNFIRLINVFRNNFTGLTLFILALSFPWLRPRLGNVGRVTVACLICTFLSFVPLFTEVDGSYYRFRAFLSAPWISTGVTMKQQNEVNLSSVKPIIHDVKIENDGTNYVRMQYGSVPMITRIKANFDTSGCPEHSDIIWKPTGSTELIVENSVQEQLDADTVELDPLENITASYYTGSKVRKNAAILAAKSFPENIRVEQMPLTSITGNWHGNSATEFRVKLPATIPTHDSLLNAGVTGIVYQWKKTVDMEMDDTTIHGDDGFIRWSTRHQFSANNENVSIELSAYYTQDPAKPLQISRPCEPDQNHCFFLYLPTKQVALKLEQDEFSDTPVNYHTHWCRFSFKIPRKYLSEPSENLNLENARLLIFRADVVGRTPEIKVRIPLSTEKSNAEPDEFARWNSEMFGLKEKSYTDPALSGPPDPETGSETEFSRWLRSPSPTIGYRSAIDLRCYAHRFSSLLVSIAGNKPRATELSLSLGMHESQAETVIENIKTAPDPQIWANVARNRGWTKRAKEALAARLKEGSLKDLSAVMSLEDLALYPALIEQLLLHPDLNTYGKLRLLPGIEPLLSESITHAARQADLNALKSKAAKHDPRERLGDVDYGPYLIDAKQGNAESLLAIWSIQSCLDARDRYFSLTLQLGDVVRFSGKTPEIETLTSMRAEDFRYDPLLRRWSLK